MHIKHTKTFDACPKIGHFRYIHLTYAKKLSCVSTSCKTTNIKIHPVAYLGKKYQRNDWWYEGHGARDFFTASKPGTLHDHGLYTFVSY